MAGLVFVLFLCLTTVVQMKMLPPKKFQSAIVVMASVQEAINVLTMFHWATVDTNSKAILFFIISVLGAHLFSFTKVPSAQGAHDLNLRVNFSTSKRDNNNAGGAYAPQNAYQTGFPPQSFRMCPSTFLFCFFFFFLKPFFVVSISHGCTQLVIRRNCSSRRRTTTRLAVLRSSSSIILSTSSTSSPSIKDTGTKEEA